jgi:putative phage-type endonuclease
MEQRDDPKWWAARLGKVTASRVADVVAKTKTGYSASRENYMADLIVERLTGQKASSFSNAAMEWGTEQEPNARAAYSARTGELVEEVGFIDHPAIPMSGASPDGLVNEGCVEFKCPNTATHLQYLLAGKPVEKYVTQLQWQMACTRRPWCDFVSYDPRLSERLQLLVVRVPRDDDYIKMLEQEVTIFLQELDDKLNKLEKVTL